MHYEPSSSRLRRHLADFIDAYNFGLPRIKPVRALVFEGGGGDYHDKAGAQWIDDHVASPMARYPGYRASRRAFGINVLGTLVVEIEADNGYHFMTTRHNSPFTEMIMMAPQADAVLPAFGGMLADEPVPENGRLRVSALEAPGFGVRLADGLDFRRPYAR